MKKKERFSWDDLKQIIEFKTFYLILILFLLGIICLITGYIVPNEEGFPIGTILSSLGITFISSSTVTILSEVFMKMDIAESIGEKIFNDLPSDIKGNVGVVEFKKDRKSIDFKEFWRNAYGTIRIIGVSANDVLASPNIPLIKERLEADRSIKIEILLLAPWSYTAITRSRAKGYQTKYEGILKTHAVMKDIQELNDSWYKKHGYSSNLELRIYDDIPSISMVINEEYAIVAPFMVVEIGGSSPYYIAKKTRLNEGIYSLYVDHFDEIWKGAMVIPENVDMNNIYIRQLEKENKINQSIPKTYNDWLLQINHGSEVPNV